jgi:hypothetical protein
MKIIASVAMLLAASTLIGCFTPSTMTTKYHLGPAGPAIEEAVNTVGGLKAIQDIDEIHANAVVTWYNPSGEGTVSAEKMVIYPNAGRIESSGALPQGTWQASVRLDGGANISTTGSLKLSKEQNEAISGYLRIILHRVRGVRNLLNGGESVLGAQEIFTAGYHVTRVEVTGRPELASGYFFGVDCHELRLLTTGAVEAPGPGTVTIYTNERMPNGLLLPTRLRVVTIGEYALVGQRVLLDVELRDLMVE